MRKVVLVGLLALAACGDDTLHMEKLGAPKAERQKDHYECLRDAYGTGGATALPYGVVRRDPNLEIYQACLEARGYVRVK